ncbi:MAG: type II toxin-antitoxin system VapC family toxin [Chloroflexi bacterium]|nr:type II toxin-antitoxin system VapC family toxin [Chloroflexota bacterium]
MSWLVDTNVLSELRKGERAPAGVRAWFAGAAEDELFTSVLVLGELRRGVESIRRRDVPAALALEQWLTRLTDTFSERILPIDSAIADRWGRLNVPDPIPTVDGLLAATALVHDLTLVTRNTRDVERTGVRLLDPGRTAT